MAVSWIVEENMRSKRFKDVRLGYASHEECFIDVDAPGSDKVFNTRI